MDPNAMLAALSQPIKELARVEATRAATAALKQARQDMLIMLAVAVILSVGISKFWR